MKLHLHDMETGIICNEDGLAIADCNTAPRIDKQVKANAAFIVRSCNNFDRMKNALIIAQSRLAKIEEPIAGSALLEVNKAIQEAEK